MYCFTCKARLPNAISTHSINKLNRWTRVLTRATDRARRAHGPVCNLLETSQLSLSCSCFPCTSFCTFIIHYLLSHTLQEKYFRLSTHNTQDRPPARISQKHGWHTHSRAEPKSTDSTVANPQHSRHRTCPPPSVGSHRILVTLAFSPLDSSLDHHALSNIPAVQARWRPRCSRPVAPVYARFEASIISTTSRQCLSNGQQHHIR